MPAYLFDIGNVLIHFDFDVAIGRIADRCQVPRGDIPQSLAHLTRDLELGHLERAAFLSRTIERLGFEGSPDELAAAFEDIFTPNDPMVALVESLHLQASPLYLLSNTNAIHEPYFTDRYPVFSRFHGATYSHQVGAMKPDPSIYQHAIESHGLDPAQTVYIDDLEANVLAGRAAGLQALHYQAEEHDAFLEAFEALERRLRDAPES